MRQTDTSGSDRASRSMVLSRTHNGFIRPYRHPYSRSGQTPMDFNSRKKMSASTSHMPPGTDKDGFAEKIFASISACLANNSYMGLNVSQRRHAIFIAPPSQFSFLLANVINTHHSLPSREMTSASNSNVGPSNYSNK